MIWASCLEQSDDYHPRDLGRANQSESVLCNREREVVVRLAYRCKYARTYVHMYVCISEVFVQLVKGTYLYNR